MTVSAETISYLLALLYEAAAAPPKWTAFLAALAKQVNADSANLMTAGFSLPEDTYGTLVYTVGVPPESQAQYSSYFGLRDPLLQGYRTRHPQGGTARSSDFIDPAIYHRSEFYNDFAKHYKFEHLCFSTIEGTSTRSSGLGLSRSQKHGDFDSETIALIDALLPHLRRAIQLNRTITRLNAHRLTTIGAMNIAALGLREQGFVGIVSGVAEEILREEDGLLWRNGKLSAADPTEDARLQDLIASTVAAGCYTASQWQPGPARSSASLAITRSAGKHPLQLALFPFRSSELLLQDRPCAIVLLIDPDRKPAATAQTLRSLYGLTPAEGRLTELLLTGRDLAECADLLGNTIETARVRLKTIMRKTNLSRQSELIRLLVGFPDLRFAIDANPNNSPHLEPSPSIPFGR